MSFSEFVKPYADGYEDFEVGGTPVTAAILNNNYDGFLLALNSWASDVETDIGQIETDLNGKSTVSISNLLQSGTRIGILTIDGTPYNLYAPSGGGGGSSVVWDQIQDTGTKIAEIEIDGVPTDVYSPTPIDVEANPTGSSTAGNLTKLKVGDSIYSIPSGGSGSSVTWDQIQTTGTKIAEVEIDGVPTDVYSPTPIDVEGNPSGSATAGNLNKLKVGDSIYSIPSGGGETEVSMNVKTTSTGGSDASIELITYNDYRNVLYTTVTGESNAVALGAVKLYYEGASGGWQLKARNTCEYNGDIYNEGDLIRNWLYSTSVDMDILYTVSMACHTIIDKNGTSMVARSGLQFVGNVSVSDDDANNRTVVSISGGGSGSSVTWDQIQTTGTKIAEVEIDGTSTDVYSPTPIDVEGNPSGSATAGNLTKLKVGESIYSIPSGGGGGGSSADEITYDNSSSGLDAENVQDAIDEVNDKFDGLPIPMQYKGTIGTGGTIQSLPLPSSDNVGFVYKVITEADYLLSTAYYRVIRTSPKQTFSNSKFDVTKASDENYENIILEDSWEIDSGVSPESFRSFDDTLTMGHEWVGGAAGFAIKSLVDGVHYNNLIYNDGDIIYSKAHTNTSTTVTGITYGPSIHAKVGDIFISTGLEWTYIPSGDEANSFAELSDTNISNPTNGQVPIYNSTSGKWENGNSSGGSSVTWDQIQTTGTKIAEVEIDGVPTDVYSPTPIDVEGNPTGSATAGDLNKLKVGNSIYSIPSGGSSSAEETTYDNSSSGLDAENVQDAIDEVNDKFDSLPIPMQYKGTIGTGGTIQSLPSPSSDNAGFVYKVITETYYLLSTVYYKIRQYNSGTGYWAFEATKAADENYTEIIKNQIFDPRDSTFAFYDFDNTLSVGRSTFDSLIINSLVDGIHYNNNVYNTGDVIYTTRSSGQTVTGIMHGPSIHAKVGDIFISTGLEWTYIPSGDEANSFAELSDTNISNPTNGQIPIYNSTSGKWENGNSSSGTTDYEELSNLPAINGYTLFNDSTKETLGLEVELTQEEYDDLPSSKYSDDITYYITDSSNRSGETFVSLPVYAEWWTANTDSSTNTDYPYIYETSNIFQIDESDDTFFWTIDGADIFPTDNEKSAIKLVKEAVIDINNVPVGSFNLIRLYATGLPQVDLVFKMVRRY